MKIIIFTPGYADEICIEIEKAGTISLLLKLKAMKRIIRMVWLAVFAVTMTATAYSQANYVLAPNPKLTVAGTSTIHDWVMESSEARGQGDFEIEQGKVTGVRNLEVIMPVKSLKSGKKSMDGNAYEALNEKRHPDITFRVTRITPGSGNRLDVEGRLTVGGNTRTIHTKVEATATGNTVTAKGGFSMKFSEFDLEPPTAVFGSIKTGDELEIAYELTFRLKS